MTREQTTTFMAQCQTDILYDEDGAFMVYLVRKEWCDFEIPEHVMEFWRRQRVRFR